MTFVAGVAATGPGASITIGAPVPSSAGNTVEIPVSINNIQAGDFLVFVSIPAGTGTLSVTSTAVSPVFGYAPVTFQQSGGSRLGFSGTITQVQAALDTLTFAPASGNVGVELAVSITEAPSGGNASNIYYFPDNGHYYELVQSSPSITWVEARDLAAGRTLFGQTGYLVTITSEAESEFVFSQINAPEIWIGASDDVATVNAVTSPSAGKEGDWYWVTGPEAGTKFWTATDVARQWKGERDSVSGTGTRFEGRYEAWRVGEPNNAGTNGEHFGAANFGTDITASENWNDFNATTTLTNALVEYGDIPGQTSTAVSAAATACFDLTDGEVSGCSVTTIVETGGVGVSAVWAIDSGVITANTNQNVDINASVIADYLASNDLTIDAGTIVVAADIVSASANNLILRATNSITLQPGHNVTTAGGDVIFWADSDADGIGGIKVGNDMLSPVSAATIATQGGDIILSGGADPLFDGAGFDASLGRAHSEYYFAVGVFGATLDARSSGEPGGNIVIRGNSGDTFDGLVWTTQLGGRYGADTNLITQGAGAIKILGDGSLTPANATPTNSRNSWGVVSAANLETEFGDISLVGAANVTRTNARGFSLSGRVQSVSGTISIDDQTSNTVSSNYTGPYINGVSLGQGTLTASSSDIILIADKFQFDNNPSLITDGSITIEPQGNSFIGNLNQSFLLGPSVSGLTFGKPTNTTAIIFDRAYTIDGPIVIYAGDIAINAEMTAVESDIHLHSGGVVTQSAAIVADGLGLNGGGGFTLQNSGNSVNVIAGGASDAPLSSVSYFNGDGLIIGAVNPSGIYATGAVLIETPTGDIAVTQPISSALSTGAAIVLNAGKDKDVGDRTGGDILVSGDGAIIIESGAVAELFSGSPGNSVGLLGVVDEGFIFYDETVRPPEASIFPGNAYAIFRDISEAIDYQALGVSTLTDDSSFAIELIADLTGNQSGIDSLANLIELADAVGRINQALMGQRPSPMLTPADFALAGLTGVNLGNLSGVIRALYLVDPSLIMSLSDLQALIDEVPDPLPVSVMGHPLWWMLLATLMLLFVRRVRPRLS